MSDLVLFHGCEIKVSERDALEFLINNSYIQKITSFYELIGDLNKVIDDSIFKLLGLKTDFDKRLALSLAIKQYVSNDECVINLDNTIESRASIIDYLRKVDITVLSDDEINRVIDEGNICYKACNNFLLTDHDKQIIESRINGYKGVIFDCADGYVSQLRVNGYSLLIDELIMRGVNSVLNGSRGFKLSSSLSKFAKLKKASLHDVFLEELSDVVIKAPFLESLLFNNCYFPEINDYKLKPRIIFDMPKLKFLIMNHVNSIPNPDVNKAVVNGWLPDFIFRTPVLEELSLYLLGDYDFSNLNNLNNLNRLELKTLNSLSVNDLPSQLVDDFNELLMGVNSGRLKINSRINFSELLMPEELNALTNIISRLGYSMSDVSLFNDQTIYRLVGLFFDEARRVSHLKLSNLDLTFIPEEITYFSNLKVLDLSGNNIRGVSLISESPIEVLNLDHTLVRDVTPLSYSKVKRLSLKHILIPSVDDELLFNGPKVVNIKEVLNPNDIDDPFARSDYNVFRDFALKHNALGVRDRCINDEKFFRTVVKGLDLLTGLDELLIDNQCFEVNRESIDYLIESGVKVLIADSSSVK